MTVPRRLVPVPRPAEASTGPAPGERVPTVSIGMPVYNGERFVGAAIESILGQTFGDLELIISDNGSTDRTEEICRHYASIDPRVRYERHEENRGAAWNYERVRALARAPYFKWAAHDDVLAPGFVERCVDALDGDPTSVLAFAGVAAIDEEGRQTRVKLQQLRAPDPLPHLRFRQVISSRANPEAVWGVVRREALERTRGHGSYCSADRVLVAELALLGRFFEIPDVMFFNRDHSDRSVRAEADFRRRRQWFDPSSRVQVVPSWRLGLEHFVAVARSPHGWRTKLRCWAQLPYWALGDMRNLGQDLVLLVVRAVTRAGKPGRARRENAGR